MDNTKVCPECDTANPEVAIYCRHCRYKFNNASLNNASVMPVIKYFKPEDTYVFIGIPFNIVWETDNCSQLFLNRVEILNSITNQRIEITQPTNFTLRAENEFQMAEKTINIVPLCVPKINSIRVLNSTIKKGTSTSIRWNVEHFETLYLEYENQKYDVSNVSEYSITPSHSVEIILTAYSRSGVLSASKEALINVVDKVVITTFEANKNAIIESEPIRFSWDILNAEKLTLQTSNMHNIDVTGKTCYDLKLGNSATISILGQNQLFSAVSQQIEISVIPLPRINTVLLPNIGSVQIDVPYKILPSMSEADILEQVTKISNIDDRNSLFSILKSRGSKLCKYVMQYAKLRS